ncbi:MAG TPA: hypothetical protein VF228_12280 [Iamia sp.]
MRLRALTRPARAVATGAALAGLVLSATSCNVGRPTAASIEGREISVERLDELVAAFIEADPETNGPQLEGEGEDTYRMSAVAGILNTLVIQVAQTELAQREGAIPTEEERTEAEDLVRNSFATGAEAEPDPATGEISEEAAAAQETSAAVFDALSTDTQEWLVDLRATTLALTRELAEGADLSEQARQAYESDPSVYDALCLRAIIVGTDALEGVQDRLAAGDDFGAVSAEVTIDPDIAAANGELGGCLTPSELTAAGLAQPIVDLVTPLEVGEVSEPVELEEGTVALFDVSDRQPTPFEEVQADIEATLPDPGEAALADLVQGSIVDLDIDVDPRFGTWDASTGTITPPDGARTPAVDSELVDATSGITVPAGG